MNRPAKTPFIALGFALGALAAGPAYAQDSDGDGAANINDAYPCDASIAAVSFAPAEGQHAALLFEDQWPALGDADFNDAVITYNYVIRENAAGGVVAITATFNAIALGGIFDNGLGLHLPIAASAVASVTRTVGSGPARALMVSTTDSELTIDVSSNLRELLSGQPGQINSVSGASVAGNALQVDIILSTPISASLSASAPFDVFLFRADDHSHQIHRQGFAGTADMNSALFGTQSDASDPVGGLYFRTTQSLPFVIELPVFDRYPEEGVDIANLFPNIVSFATSGGTQNTDFYSNGINPRFAYVGTPAVNSTFVSTETIDQSCLPSINPDGAANPGSTSVVPVLLANAGSDGGVAFGRNIYYGEYWWGFNPNVPSPATYLMFRPSRDPNPEYLGYRFSSGKIVNKYTIRHSMMAVEDYASRNISNWELQGSLDTTDGHDGVWVTLDSRSQNLYSNGVTTTHTFVNSIAYTSYRVLVNAVNNTTHDQGHVTFVEFIEAR